MSFLEDIGAQENDGTPLAKDAEKENLDDGSAGVTSADQVDSSGDENSSNEESEEEQASGDSAYGSDKDTENYTNLENADSENETDGNTEPSPPRTRSRSQKGT